MASFDNSKIVDPFTTILKLAMFAINNRNDCLIAIENNAIKYDRQQPRGLMNMIFGGGDGENDLKYLEEPIKYACSKYLFDEEYEEKMDEMEKIFLKAGEGLELLQNIYAGKNNQTVARCVKSYMEPIRYNLMKLHAAKQTQATMSYGQTAFNEITNAEMYEHVDRIWSKGYVNMAIDLFGMITDVAADERSHFMTMMNDYLMYFDMKTRVGVITYKMSSVEVDG